MLKQIVAGVSLATCLFAISGGQVHAEEQQPQYISTAELQTMTEEIGYKYNIDPCLLQAMCEKESSKNIYAENGTCKGLMQISEKWHTGRMEELGITDIYDPYSNILLAADYLSELSKTNDDVYYMLMRYNMKTSTANELYDNGQVTDYALGIVAREQELDKTE